MKSTRPRQPPHSLSACDGGTRTTNQRQIQFENFGPPDPTSYLPESFVPTQSQYDRSVEENMGLLSWCSLQSTQFNTESSLVGYYPCRWTRTHNREAVWRLITLRQRCHTISDLAVRLVCRACGSMVTSQTPFFTELSE